MEGKNAGTNASGKKSRKQQREPLTATPTDVFVKYPYLFVPFLDRVSLNRLFSTRKEIHAEASSRTVTLPWPEKRIEVSASVWCVAFSRDGGLLAYGYRYLGNNCIRIWSRSDGQRTLWSRDQRTLLEEHTGKIESFSFSPDGKFIASVGWDRTIRLWKLDDQSYRVFEGHTDSVISVEFSPDGSTLASGSDDGSVRLWNVNEGTCTKILRDNRMLGVSMAAWSPNGATIAAADCSGLILFWDIPRDQNAIRAPVIFQGHDGAVTTIAYSPDGRYLASGSSDNTAKLWNVANLSCLKTFAGHSSWVKSVCFSPSGKILASGSFDESVRLWDVEAAAAAAAAPVDGSCLRNLSGRHHMILSLSFSPDGRTLASGGSDGIVRLCDMCVPI
jgi:WD40 repeat protein